eukprot:6180524-Pleurochrysis_carterae.AAC.2
MRATSCQSMPYCALGCQHLLAAAPRIDFSPFAAPQAPIARRVLKPSLRRTDGRLRLRTVLRLFKQWFLAKADAAFLRLPPPMRRVAAAWTLRISRARTRRAEQHRQTLAPST